MAQVDSAAVVLAAIADQEGPAGGGGYPCTNESIAEATGLGSNVVSDALYELWRAGKIEGILTTAEVRPYLMGIRRVLPGRPRVWGAGGQFVELPGR